MEPNNNIDQFFKDKLENREFVLEDVFIADLEKKLDQQKKAFYWWKLLLIFLFVGGVFFTGYYYLGQGDTVIAAQVNSSSTFTGPFDSKELEEKESSLLNDKENLNTDKIGREANNLNEVKENKTISALESESEKTSQPEKNTTALNSKKVNPVNVEENAKANDAKNNFKPVNEATTIAAINSNKVKKTSTSLGGNVKDNPNTGLTVDKVTKPTKDMLKKEVDLAGEQPKKDSVSGVENKKTDAINKNETDAKKDSATADLVTNQVDSNQTNKKDAIDTTTDVAEAEKDKKPKKSTDFKRWSLAVSAGPAMISKNISGTENEKYYSVREGAEKNITALAYGVELGYFFNKQINISSGINYLTYGEDVKYEEKDITTNTTSVISSYDSTYTTTYITDSIGVIIDSIITATGSPNYSDQTTNDTTSKKYENKNRYSYIHIPFMLGYKKRFNKLEINFKAGIVYGRLVKSNGSYFNTDITEFIPVDLKKDIFNIAFATAISYPINKINLFIEPKYQFNISNVFPSSKTDQKYKAFGVNFGISVVF